MLTIRRDHKTDIYTTKLYANGAPQSTKNHQMAPRVQFLLMTNFALHFASDKIAYILFNALLNSLRKMPGRLGSAQPIARTICVVLLDKTRIRV